MKKSLIIFLLLSFFLAYNFTGCKFPSPKRTTGLEQFNADILNESLNLGNKFLLNSQKEEGNFIYEYDFVKKKYNPQDSQVRQAGALWGIALLHHYQSSKQTLKSLIKGFEFFDRYSKLTQDGRKYIAYPGQKSGRTGTVALVALSLIELLTSETTLEPNLRYKYEYDLSRYIKFLLSLRMNNGQFYEVYNLESGAGYGKSSPYFDGEALLALTKAAKYLGYSELKTIILESAEDMYANNVRRALKWDSDSDTTKGFYQWGSMAYYELYTSGWEDTAKYADRVIDLAYWMIDVHKTLKRTRNTAYAYEGLVVAWELAHLTQNTEAQRKIKDVIDEGLYKLTTWQVGGPLKTKFRGKYKSSDPLAVGGVLNHKDESILRIDVTQHQMHALILAKKYIYK